MQYNKTEITGFELNINNINPIFEGKILKEINKIFQYQLIIQNQN